MKSNYKPQVKLSPAQYRVMLARMMAKEQPNTRQEAMQTAGQIRQSMPMPGVQAMKAPAPIPQAQPSGLGTGLQEGKELWDTYMKGSVGAEMFKMMTGGDEQSFVDAYAVYQRDPKAINPQVASFISQVLGSVRSASPVATGSPLNDIAEEMFAAEGQV